MGTKLFQRSPRLAAWLMVAVLLFGVQFYVPAAYAEGETNNGSAVQTEQTPEESSALRKMDLLQDWASLLQAQLGLPQEQSAPAADLESWIGALEESVGQMETTLGMDASDFSQETDTQAQMDTLLHRMLLIEKQIQNSQAADALNELEQLRTDLQSLQNKTDDLERSVGTARAVAIVAIVIGALAFLLVLALGGYVLFVLCNKMKSLETDAARYAATADVQRERTELERKLSHFQDDVQNLRRRVEEMELPRFQVQANEPVLHKREQNPMPNPPVQKAAPQIQPMPSAQSRQSNVEAARLKAEFDISLSDNIFLSPGNDYILYEDDTMEYAMRGQVSGVDAYMRNGLLRLYDIQVGDAVYTYRQCKEGRCPASYLKIKNNLKRAKVRQNSAGTYDLVQAGVLEAEKLN